MEIWAVIAILILLVITVGFIGLTYWTERKNAEKQQHNILYPFSGSVNPNKTGQNVVLTRAPYGQNQIECPKGYHVNIVGAFVEVDDPFGECSPSPGSTFRATCGDDTDRSSAIKCSDSSNCASGMDCIEGRCLPKSCSTSEDCGGNTCPSTLGKTCSRHDDCGGSPMMCANGICQVDPNKGQCTYCRNGRCAQAPTCSNLNNSYQNTTCASSNTKNKCRPRDASAYLAKECDGKQSCTVSWDPSSSKFFGPLPCKIETENSEYSTLPVVAGWGGGKPKDGTSLADANYRQGYYVHGIFTCKASSE